LGFISFLEEHLLSCQWKDQFGAECAGCGLQRSVILLLKGEFVEAFYMYPAIYTLIIMFTYLGLHLKFDFKRGSKILLYLFIINILIIASSYVIKTN
jgi:hypothetical protein